MAAGVPARIVVWIVIEKAIVVGGARDRIHQHILSSTNLETQIPIMNEHTTVKSDIGTTSRLRLHLDFGGTIFQVMNNEPADATYVIQEPGSASISLDLILPYANQSE
jgi:hypothetical protein